MNQTFSSARFSAYFRKYLGEQSRKLLLQWGIMFFVCLITFILPPLLTGCAGYASGSHADYMWEDEVATSTILLYLFAMISGSRIYSEMRSKESRIATLTTPASMAEKALTYLILYIPAFLAAFYISVFAADYIRVVTLRWLTPVGDLASPIPFSYMIMLGFQEPFTPSDIMQMATIYGGALITQALYALGGLIWPRNSFGKTFCALSVIAIILLMILKESFSFWFDGPFESRGFTETSFTTAGWFIIGLAATAILLHLLAYRRFKESDIVNRW